MYLVAQQSEYKKIESAQIQEKKKARGIGLVGLIQARIPAGSPNREPGQVPFIFLHSETKSA